MKLTTLPGVLVIILAVAVQAVAGQPQSQTLRIVLTDLATTTASPTGTTTSVLMDYQDLDLPEDLDLPAADLADRFTTEQVLRQALSCNAGLQAARARFRAAEHEARVRSAANNPQLQFGGTWVPVPSPDEGQPRGQFPDTDESSLSYVFPTSGSRTHAVRAAQARLQAASAELKLTTLEVVLTTRTAYAELQFAQELVSLYEDTYRIAMSIRLLADQQVRAGAVPDSNKVRTQIEEAKAEQDLHRSHAELLTREMGLALQMGRTGSVRTAAADPLAETTTTPDLPALTTAALTRRPEVDSAFWDMSAAAADMAVARAGRRPDLTVATSFTDHLTNTGNPPVRAFLTLPLWDRGKIGGEVAQASQRREAARLTLEQVRRQVAFDVARAVRQVQAAQAVLMISRDRIVPHTELLLGRNRVAYMAGAGTLLEVLDAQRVYREAAVGRLTAAVELAKARAGLERVTAGAYGVSEVPRVEAVGERER